MDYQGMKIYDLRQAGVKKTALPFERAAQIKTNNYSTLRLT
jgi:hypothetical protein